MPSSSCPTDLQPNHISTCTPPAPFVLIYAEIDQAPSPKISTRTKPTPSPDISHATAPAQHADTQSAPTNTHSMVTRSNNNIHLPRQSSEDFIRYPLLRALIAEHILIEKEPTSYSQASKSIHWREAMNKEFLALLHNGTWSLVSPPITTNIIGCQWIYKIQRKADGTIERYKARLVAKGFHQQK